MSIVAIGVDCQAAGAEKCFTREIVRVAEDLKVPLTWLISVSPRDPMANVNLYHNEYLHRIPAWHEFGLHLTFENSSGYISDPKARADAIRVAKDVLKQVHIKPTAFRAGHHDLLPDDLKVLEDVGILVDCSACPGARDKHQVRSPEGPTQPYHPSYTDLTVAGEAGILMAPIATYGGVCGYLDNGWDLVKPVVAHSLDNDEVTVLGVGDSVDAVSALRCAIEMGLEKGARFVTTTSLAGK